MLLTVLVGSLLLVVPAGATPTATPAAAAGAGAGGPEALDLDTSGVSRYWDADRMRNASPLDLAPDGDPIDAAPGGGNPPPGADARRSAGSTGVRVPRSTGKLFFRTPSGDAVCSAAAVNTAGRNTLLTAGHCVNSGATCGLLGCSPGRTFSDFLFVPRYAAGAAPDGRWVGTRALVHQQWVQTRDAFAYDHALIEVAPVRGRNLVDVVGGNAVAWGYPAVERGVSVWGWPAETPYDGSRGLRCVGSTVPTRDSGDAALACGFTGGASGGPWFHTMLTPDVGFIWAVTSRRSIGGAPTLYATPLTRAVRSLLAAAGSVPVSTRSASAPRAAGAPAARAAARPRGGKARAKVRVHVGSAEVGHGQPFVVRVRAPRRTKVVLRVRYGAGQPWRNVARARSSRGGLVRFAVRATHPGAHRYQAVVVSTRKLRRGESRVVRVRVRDCPLPPDRRPAVLAALGCTVPAT